MMRSTAWAMALALSSLVTAGAAHAGRSHVNVAIVAGVNRPVFFHPFFHPFSPFFHPFFRSSFFFAAPFFAPSPVAFVPPPPAFYPSPVVYPPYSAAPATSSQNCRQVQLTITIDGQPQAAFGTACQQSDGTWRFVG
jgi:hypothetical protein